MAFKLIRNLNEKIAILMKSCKVLNEFNLWIKIRIDFVSFGAQSCELDSNILFYFPKSWMKLIIKSLNESM